MKLRLPHISGVALAAMMFGTSVTASAVPAYPGKRTYTQPDGTTLTLSLRGDESLHFFVDDNGYLIDRDTNGWFRFIDNDGSLTGIKAGNYDMSATEQAKLASLSPASAFSSLNSKASAMRAAKAGSPMRAAGVVPPAKWDNADGHDLRNVPTDGERHVLIILVNFADINWSFSDNPQQDMSDMLNAPGFNKFNCTGSAKDYFLTSSNGIYQPSFDVYGPVNLPNNCEYYGGNTGGGPGGGNDKNPGQMVVDACRLLDDQIDFTKYDTNQDGVVDNVYILYAGYGENEGAPASTIWPHSYNLAYTLPTLPEHDGVKIDRYACSNELTYNQYEEGVPTMAGIGTFCHEFSHVLGLPDLYATTYTGAFTPDEFAVMDHGSYNNNGRTPPVYNIYERYALEWQKPIDISAGEDITMLPLSDGGNAYKITIDPKDPKEYYLFENRQQKSWDTYLPAHGMLVWHIDYDNSVWFNNTVNNNPTHQHVDLIEADGMQVKGSMTGATFPGSKNIGEFTATTSPAFINWNGKQTALPITNIYENNNGVMGFRVGEGGSADSALALPAPKVRLTKGDSGSLTLAWDKVNGATGYVMSVMVMETDIFGTFNRSYVPGYQLKSVGDVGTVTLSDLKADTSYAFEVYAVNDKNMSKAAESCYSTFVSNFANIVPELSVTPDKEIAILEWAEVPAAEYYTATVATRTLSDTSRAALINFDNSKIPAGTLFSGAQYDLRESYSGETAPSLRFTMQNGQLTTPSYSDDISSISFWARVNRQNADFSFKLYSLDIDYTDPTSGGKLTLFAEVNNVAASSEGSKVTITDIPEGVHQVLMTYNYKTPGLNFCIDDIEINTSKSFTDTPVGQYDKMRVDGQRLTAEGLAQETPYVAYIRAHNSEGSSALSKTVHFTTTDTTGIDSVTGDNESGFTVGNGIVSTTGSTAMSIYTIDGRTIAVNALGAVQLPGHGIYIVKCGSQVRKISY